MPNRRCCNNNSSSSSSSSSSSTAAVFSVPLQTWSLNHNHILLAIPNINSIISIISSKYYGSNSSGKEITFIKINLQRQPCNLPQLMHITGLEVLQNPSNWNHNTATTAKVPQQPPPQLNTNLQQVKAKETVLTQQPVQQGIAQSAPTANLKTRPGQGRGVSQQPAWMQNVNNNDSIAVETSVPRNNSLNNVVPPSQTEKARWGRGRGGRGRGSDINKPAWMTENSNTSQPQVGRSNDSKYRSPADFAPSQRPQPQPQQQPKPEQNTSNASSSNVIEWPQSLKDYIKRNFDSCSTDEQKALVQAKLRPIVTDAVANKLLLEIDWNNEPLLLHHQDGQITRKFKKSKKSAKVKRRRDDTGISKSMPRDDWKRVNAVPHQENLNESSGGSLIKADKAELSKRQERANRFRSSLSKSVNRENTNRGGGRASVSQSRDDRTLNLLRNIAGRGGQVNWDLVVIKGTCQNLEKDYFRLTSCQTQHLLDLKRF